MIRFLKITVHEKGKGEDYRSFLDFADSDTMTVYQIRGYGDSPGKSVDDAYANYDSEDREMHVTDEWAWI